MLDWVQAIGVTPAVNPVRVKDGVLPPVTNETKLGFWAWLSLAVVGLLLILAVALFGPPTTGGFIYEQF